MFKNKILTILLIIPGSLFLMSWGWQGHQKISGNAPLSYTAQMNQFHEWTQILVAFSTEADDRKQFDPDESPKHYIDIDFYDSFNSTGRIPQRLDSLIFENGYFTVYDMGILPFAIETTFDSLTACFIRGDWEKAVLVAADLGHYVADGHMPLHITENYNGQMSGNTGIHSRFESTMINNNIESIVYEGWEVEFIPNVNQYIFDFIYTNHYYKDSILAADNYAKGIAGSTNSSAYKQALWEKSKDFTILLFKNASHALAEMIYTSWVLAGSPAMPSQGIDENALSFSLEPVFPNPVSTVATISFSSDLNQYLELYVTNLNGVIVDDIFSGRVTPGNQKITWNPECISPGSYYLILTDRKRALNHKMILLN